MVALLKRWYGKFSKQHACVLLQAIKVYKRTTFLLHCVVWIQSGADYS